MNTRLDSLISERGAYFEIAIIETYPAILFLNGLLGMIAISSHILLLV